MKVEQIYTKCLAQGSYYIESNGEAVVIDPLRDVNEYINLAEESNSKIKLDPTIINGGVINSIKSTAKLGKSDWSILEADESDGSFVHIPPTYSIITNIDDEHLEHYGSIENLKKSFVSFAEKTPSFGKAFLGFIILRSENP